MISTSGREPDDLFVFKSTMLIRVVQSSGRNPRSKRTRFPGRFRHQDQAPNHRAFRSSLDKRGLSHQRPPLVAAGGAGRCKVLLPRLSGPCKSLRV